ncbi:MAG: sugar transferase [bacterium]|nr:sugar transferase [bacterium]
MSGIESRIAAEHAAAYARGIKRGIDLVISIIALSVFVMALTLLAPAIKLDSRGPVFFLQPRIGIDRRRRRVPFPPQSDRRHVINPGRPFRIFKLRTMCPEAESNGPQLAVENDERMTRVGRVLRKTRLDEFPQFANVLRGEMSVIGPRPERLYFIRQFEHDVPHYRERLVVLPGITGLAQVINGYDTDLESVRRKVVLDREYIDSLSLRNDLRILALTFKVMLDGEGAH